MISYFLAVFKINIVVLFWLVLLESLLPLLTKKTAEIIWNNMFLFTVLIVYIGYAVIYLILLYSVLELGLDQKLATVFKFAYLVLQICWNVHEVHVFFRKSDKCNEKNPALWTAHLVLVVYACVLFFYFFILHNSEIKIIKINLKELLVLSLILIE